MTINFFSFTHIVNTPNIGDKYCAPYHYFHFPHHNVYDINKQKIPKSRVVIYGGGAIEPRLRVDRIHDPVDAKFKIAWGIGTSRSGMKFPPDLVDDLDLCGRREFGRNGGEYIPCVSAMSQFFDKKYDAKNDIVLYKHGVKSKFNTEDTNQFPSINNRASFEEAIKFLGESRVIVTDSFHGTYWGLLLGKKVICIPFSSKFYGFKFPPIYSTYSSWKEELKNIPSYDADALEDCRRLNIRFYNKVMDLVS